MAVISRLPAALTMAAALSMATTPAVAADLPVPAPSSVAPADAGWDSASEDVQRHRGRHHRRHRGVDAGDVIAGVVIIGAIAAIAGAASRNNDRDRNRRYRDERYRTRDTRTDDRRSNVRQTDNRGLDNAVDMCMRRIERDVRVDSVDNVSRNGEGWNVSGSLYNGEGFSCRIGNDGQISDINFGGRSVAATQDRQWSDDRYAQAWDNADRTAPTAPAPVQTAQAPADQGQPAYPGGPVEGVDNRPVWTGGDDNAQTGGE